MNAARTHLRTSIGQLFFALLAIALVITATSSVLRPASVHPATSSADYSYGQGYWEAGSDGGIYTFGDALFHGSMGGQHVNAPIVGIAATSDGGGYWEVGSDGGIYTFGDAVYYGSTGGQTLNKPIVGMALDPVTGGYWLVASDGGIFSFNAPFYGSTGGQHINAPIVGMAAEPNGSGYWLVGSDGGIYTFNAGYYGSMGGQTLAAPIVGMAARPDGLGYWLVGSDGGIFNFGSAPFYGSLPSTKVPQPIVGIASTGDGNGYWLAGADGGIFQYGDAQFLGSMASQTLNAPVVGVAAFANNQAPQITPLTASQSRDLAINGGFNNSLTGWSVEPNTNYAVYGQGQVAGENPYEGSGFVAMNSSASGGIYQDVPVTINTGDTYCVSAELSSQGTSTGATGALALFMLGGASQEGSSVGYGPLAGSGTWVPVQTCVTSTEPHTELQVQFYLYAGTTTADVVNLTRNLLTNGGYNNGSEGWSSSSGTSYGVYGQGTEGQNPYEGSGYAGMSSASGGSVYQSVPITINTGDTYCVSAELASFGSSTGVSGTLTISMLGGAGTETSSFSYGPLPASSIWSPAKTCVTATESHTSLQVAFNLGAGATAADAVDLTKNLATDGGFNNALSGWSVEPNTAYATYGASQVTGETPYEGSGFVAMNSPSNGVIYQDVPITINTGDTYCVSAELSSQGTANGASGSLALFMLGGASAEASSINYGPLAGSNTWVPVQTCVTATEPHTELQVQFYLGAVTTTADALEIY